MEVSGFCIRAAKVALSILSKAVAAVAAGGSLL